MPGHGYGGCGSASEVRKTRRLRKWRDAVRQTIQLCLGLPSSYRSETKNSVSRCESDREVEAEKLFIPDMAVSMPPGVKPPSAGNQVVMITFA